MKTNQSQVNESKQVTPHVARHSGGHGTLVATRCMSHGRSYFRREMVRRQALT